MNEANADNFLKIISISESMLEHARQENWEEVTRSERERQILLAEFFAKPVNVRNTDLSSGIRAVLEKDREIVRLGAVNREKLRNALKKLNQRKQAVEAYSAVG